MHGVPADLDLSKFKDATLTQLGIGEFQIQFLFHPQGNISVEGKWELRDSDGILIDQAKTNVEREICRLHIVLGKTVENYSINAPESFSLRFDSGHVLTVFDDSKQHESFSVNGIYI